MWRLCCPQPWSMPGLSDQGSTDILRLRVCNAVRSCCMQSHLPCACPPAAGLAPPVQSGPLRASAGGCWCSAAQRAPSWESSGSCHLNLKWLPQAGQKQSCLVRHCALCLQLQSALNARQHPQDVAVHPSKALCCLFMHRSTESGCSHPQQAAHAPALHAGLSEQQWGSIEVVLRCGLKALGHKGETSELQVVHAHPGWHLGHVWRRHASAHSEGCVVKLCASCPNQATACWVVSGTPDRRLAVLCLHGSLFSFVAPMASRCRALTVAGLRPCLGADCSSGIVSDELVLELFLWQPAEGVPAACQLCWLGLALVVLADNCKLIHAENLAQDAQPALAALACGWTGGRPVP